MVNSRCGWAVYSVKMKGYNQKLGQWGEDLAVKFYLKQKCEPVARNWRSRRGELDLIVKNKEELTFVEVKTRRSKNFGWGEAAVSKAKMRKIWLAMNKYVFEHPEFDSLRPRFDILVVEIDGLNIGYRHFENIPLQI